jgi:hypothetical protein
MPTASASSNGETPDRAGHQSTERTDLPVHDSSTDLLTTEGDSMKTLSRIAMTLAATVLLSSVALAQSTHTSTVFSGAKVNAGTVTHSVQGGKNMLSLSAEFKVPDTPDPHWQVVDSKGTVYLLQRLAIKGDKVNTTITLPAYIKDVAKVQIYCAWAEAVLGEASFSSTITLTN